MRLEAKMLLLSQSDVEECGGLDMKKTLEVIEKVFSLHAKGDYVMPTKTVLRWGELESEATTGRINGMPGYIGGEFNLSGIKWISSSPTNPFKYNLPRAAGVIILNEPETLLPIAVMDGTLISSMRTAANNGVAAKYLARKNSRVVGLIGAGVLNRTVLLALYHSLPELELVKIYDLDSTRTEKFIEEMSSMVPIHMVNSESAEEAVRGSDVFVTATVTKKPIIKPEWVDEGSLYLHVGGHECEYEVVHKADKIVVDDWEKVKARGNKTMCLMLNEGKFDESNISAQLGEIVNDDKVGRQDDKEFIYFNSVGMGIQDIAVAKMIYEEAKKRNLGKPFSLWEKPIFI